MGINVTVGALTTLGLGSAITTLNTNFTDLANEFDKVVYKDGREELTGTLDANSQRIINLPSPASSSEPLRLGDLASYYLATLNTIISTDPTLAANSDLFVSTQKAVKTYIDGRNIVVVKDFGATGNGTTDDRAFFASADASGRFTVSPGSYKIGSNLTISSSVFFTSGA